MSHSTEPSRLPSVLEPRRERRKWGRHHCDRQGLVRPYLGTDQMSWPADIVDVSCHGVGIVLGLRYEPGTILSVVFIDSWGAAQFTKVVRVVHVRAHDESKCVIGCAFAEKLTKSELEALAG